MFQSWDSSQKIYGPAVYRGVRMNVISRSYLLEASILVLDPSTVELSTLAAEVGQSLVFNCQTFLP